VGKLFLKIGEDPSHIRALVFCDSPAGSWREAFPAKVTTSASAGARTDDRTMGEFHGAMIPATPLHRAVRRIPSRRSLNRAERIRGLELFEVAA